MLTCMSIEMEWIGQVPEWDLADRMRKALRTAHLGVQEMADYLDVSRNTVGTWINGRVDPSVQTLRLWALRTGVPYGWLVTGEDSVETAASAVTSGPTKRRWSSLAPVYQLRPIRLGQTA